MDVCIAVGHVVYGIYVARVACDFPFMACGVRRMARGVQRWATSGSVHPIHQVRSESVGCERRGRCRGASVGRAFSFHHRSFVATASGRL